jgi:hypothetical protein
VPGDFPDRDGWNPELPVACQPPRMRAGIEREILAIFAGDLAGLYLVPGEPGAARYVDEDVDAIATQALASLGPRLAELVVAHEQAEEPFLDDEAHARQLANTSAGPEAGPLYAEMLRVEARLLVTRHHRAILRVADALEREAVLDGAQIAALVRPQKAPSRGQR